MTNNKDSISFLRKFLDFIILNLVFLFSASFAQSFALLFSNKLMFVLAFILNLTWFFSAGIFELYEDQNSRLIFYDFIKVVKNTAVQVMTAILYLFVIKEPLFLRNFILFYSIQLIFFIGLERVILSYILRYLYKKGINVRQLLIVGSNEIGHNFYKSLNSNRNSNYRIVGFVDDKEDDNYLGRIDQLGNILASTKVDDIVVALPYYELDRLDYIIRTCNKFAVRTHIIPDYFKYVSSKFKLNLLDNIPLISVRSEPLAEFHWRLAKRIFDIIISIFSLIFILSWLSPFIFLLSKIYRNGSVFFIQDRLGLKNKVFKCYKFRTMHKELENNKIFQPAYEGDPRITKIGRFMRKYNIDELPQFINILKGEMSVVGPRPHPLPYNEIYKEVVNEIQIRSWVKPGLTGWAQIHGFRGDVTNEEENKKRIMKRIEYDLWYIENWSFWLDLQIIGITLVQMLKGEAKGS